MGFEDLVDGEGVPFDGEGAELGLGGGPRGVAEDGGDGVDGGSHVGGGWWWWGPIRVGFF